MKIIMRIMMEARSQVRLSMVRLQGLTQPKMKQMRTTRKQMITLKKSNKCKTRAVRLFRKGPRMRTPTKIRKMMTKTRTRMRMREEQWPVEPPNLRSRRKVVPPVGAGGRGGGGVRQGAALRGGGGGQGDEVQG